ncbi:hypothetical protein ACFV6G_38435, partial [Streptomyces lavendulae]
PWDTARTTGGASGGSAPARAPRRGGPARGGGGRGLGGVGLKTQAARRDGATVFLVPKAECSDAKAELPQGLRLIPVTSLSGAVDSLRALQRGGEVPAC